MEQNQDRNLANQAYRVHLYSVVRVPVDVPSATSQLDAITKAEALVDLNRDFIRGDFADEVVGVLVDEVGDEEYVNTRNYLPAQTGWKEEKEVYVLVQEGGSSIELYLHAHETRALAQSDRAACADEGAYRTSPVVEVPASLATHPQFYEVVEQILAASLNLSFNED